MAVPRVKTATTPGAPELVSQEVAGGTARATAESLEAVSEVVGRTTEIGTQVGLRIALDDIKQRHFREAAEANATIESRLNQLDVDYENRKDDFDLFPADYRRDASRIRDDVLGGITDQDVLDVVDAQSRVLAESRGRKQDERAVAFEHQARTVAITVGMAAKAQSMGLARSDAERDEIRAGALKFLAGHVRAGSMTSAEAQITMAEWRNRGAMATAIGVLNSNEPLALEFGLAELLDDRTPKYEGYDEVNRQNMIHTFITELRRRSDSDSTERRQRRNDQYNNALQGIYATGTHGFEPLTEHQIWDEYDYPDLTGDQRRVLQDLLREKVSGNFDSYVNYTKVDNVFDMVASGEISSIGQLSAMIGEGLPYRALQPFIGLLNTLNDTSPERASYQLALKSTLDQVKITINPPFANGIGAPVGAKAFKMWLDGALSELSQARSEGASDLDLQRTLLNAKDDSYVGRNAKQMQPSLRQRIESVRSDLGVDPVTGESVNFQDPKAAAEALDKRLGETPDPVPRSALAHRPSGEIFKALGPGFSVGPEGVTKAINDAVVERAVLGAIEAIDVQEERKSAMRKNLSSAMFEREKPPIGDYLSGKLHDQVSVSVRLSNESFDETFEKLRDIRDAHFAKYGFSASYSDKSLMRLIDSEMKRMRLDEMPPPPPRKSKGK